MKLLAIAALAAVCQAQPQVFLGGGLSYSRYAAPPVAAGWTTLAVRIGSSPVYSFSTIDLSATTASPRTGAAYLAVQSGRTSLLALADAGVALSGGLTLGSFGGGPVIVHQLGKSPWYLIGVMRLTAVSSTAVKPVFELGIGRAF